ncbi:hypothetical protein HY441_00190 [Candidatus Microgenomates bacterium]|nr:hypothetical protein [Candidatus Microgenomates bacterium]
MKTIIKIFLCVWAVVSLILIGEQILDIRWQLVRETGPSTVQDYSGDLFNRAARRIKREQLLNGQPVAIAIEDDGLGAVAITYWLYPLRLIPYGTLDEAAADTSTQALIFAGNREALQARQMVFPGWRVTELAEDNDRVVVIIQK